MPNLTPLTDTLIAVDVPENAKTSIARFHNRDELTYYLDRGGPEFVSLPPGSWEILCRAEEVTEEVAKDLVEEKKIQSVAHTWGAAATGYKHYDNEMMFWHIALESFQSLLRSKGITGNPLLLKQLK